MTNGKSMNGALSKALAQMQTGVSTHLGEATSRRAGEPAEFVECARRAFAGTASTSGCVKQNLCYEQPAIYPADSILSDWMTFARAQEESADSFLIGSFLPVCAAILGRRAWFRWGSKKKYPNLYAILAGKPGDRKSSIILLADALCRQVLPANAFLPAGFSPETLFDEYAIEAGGRPDKIWIVDDANSVLTDWTKSSNGQRVATRFLELYDCKSLSENFRRNREDNADSTSIRRIEETSTSLVFGSTFSIAAFQHQAVRAGMARRFLYFIAERHGRLITRPSTRNEMALTTFVKSLRSLQKINGEIDFDQKSTRIWEDYQIMNREEADGIDPVREAELSRLSSAPMQTLSVAMIFAACLHRRNNGKWNRLIEGNILVKAIEHVEACLSAARRLDTIANRAEIADDAEIFLAKVRHEFPSVEGYHFATRSELTKQFCANSARAGSWRPDDLYLRLIPSLERRNEAHMVSKVGKREVYAFISDAIE